MEDVNVDEYLKKFNVKQLKQVVGLYHKPKAIPLKGLKKPDLIELSKVLMEHGIYKTDKKPRKYGAGILDFFRSPKKAYNNVSTNTIKKYGNSYIQSIKIVRTPIMSIIQKALNILTIGKNPFDRLYHLAMICDVGQSSVVIEKNEVINISTNYKITDQTEQMKVYLRKAVTLNQLLANGQKQMGDKWFTYSGLENNCQSFIMGILTGNQINDPKAKAFVKQDLTSLIKKLPKGTGAIMDATTNLAARFNQAVGGSDNKKEVKQGGRKSLYSSNEFT